MAPHIDRAALAITGSVAVGDRRPGDLDLVAARREAIAPTVQEDFLLSHYHADNKLLVQLVDPVTRLRVDIFADRLGALATARPALQGWRVVDLATVLEHKLELLANATPTAPVDPKHRDDAHALAARLGHATPVIDPAALRASEYATDLMLRCRRCEAGAAPGFALAPKAAIFGVLGYV